MDITIDDNTFHKWATEKGYVRKSDVQAVLNGECYVLPKCSQQTAFLPGFETGGGNGTTPLTNAGYVSHTAETRYGTTDWLLTEATALEQPDDLITAEQVAAAFRVMVDDLTMNADKATALAAGRAILDKLGAASVPTIPKDKYAECMRLIRESKS